MTFDEIHELLGAARARWEAGARDDAIALASAAVAEQPRLIEPWIALYEFETATGAWDRALELAEGAAIWHAHSHLPSLLRARALERLGRFEEMLAELEAALRRFPQDHDTAELLAISLSTCDPVRCLEVVETALAAGAVLRDHVLASGVTSGGFLGMFERARVPLSQLRDQQLKARLDARLRSEEESWAAHEALCAEMFPHGAAFDDLVRLRESGDIGLAVHATVVRFLGGVSPDEHDHLVHLAHGFGQANWLPLSWLAYTTHRLGNHPGLFHHYVPYLLARGAFSEAGRQLMRAPAEGVDLSYYLRMKVFCCACGGFPRQALIEGLLREVRADERARELARAYLTNSGPVEPWKAATAGAGSPIGSGSPNDLARRLYRSPQRRRPRVAICISGQLRSFRKTWPITRTALSEWEPTVFVSTWKDVGLGFGVHDTVNRLLPASVRERLPIAIQQKTRFEAQFPGVVAEMARNDSVTREVLQAFYGTEFVHVHDERPFEAACDGRPGLFAGTSLNQAKMFFAISDVSAMKSAHEDREGRFFDAVLRLRPDRTMVAMGEVDVDRVASHRVLLTDYFMAGAVGDQGTLSSSEVADRMGDIWPGMDRAGSPRFFPGATGQFNEFLLAEYLMHSGVGLRPFVATHSMGLTHLEPELAPLWRAALAEVARIEGERPDQRPVLQAFVEAAAEQHEATQAAELLAPLPPAVLDPQFLEGLSDRAVRFLSLCPAF